MTKQDSGHVLYVCPRCKRGHIAFVQVSVAMAGDELAETVYRRPCKNDPTHVEFLVGLTHEGATVEEALIECALRREQFSRRIEHQEAMERMATRLALMTDRPTGTA